MLDLLTELKRVCDEEKLLLTMTFNADLIGFIKDFNIGSLALFFDFVHFMPTAMNVNERVFRRNEIEFAILEMKGSTIRNKVDEILNWGVPHSKLVLGINFRGIYF